MKNKYFYTFVDSRDLEDGCYPYYDLHKENEQITYCGDIIKPLKQFKVLFDNFDDAVDFFFLAKKDFATKTDKEYPPLLMRFIVDETASFDLLKKIISNESVKKCNVLITNFFDLEQKL